MVPRGGPHDDQARQSLKRELLIDSKPYVLAIEPERFRLTPKGHRKGLEFAWRDLVSGEAALAAALNTSFKQPH